MAVRSSQTVVEVLDAGTPKARSSQTVAEVLHKGPGKVRVSQTVVEVLRSTAANTNYSVNATDTVTFSFSTGTTSIHQVGASDTVTFTSADVEATNHTYQDSATDSSTAVFGSGVAGTGSGISFSDVASSTKNVAAGASDTITLGYQSSAGLGVVASDTITFGSYAGLLRSVSAVDTITFVDSGHTQHVGVSATDTITFTDLANFVGQKRVGATDTITFTDPANGRNTIIRVSATDTVAFSGADFEGGIRNLSVDPQQVNFSDLAHVRNTTIQAYALDNVTFADAGGFPRTLQVGAVDQVTFFDPSPRGGLRVTAHAIDTITFTTLAPNSTNRADTVSFSDEARAHLEFPVASAAVAFADDAEAVVTLPNPELGLSVVLRSGVSPEYPFTYCQTPDGVVLIANGVDPVFRFVPSNKRLDTAGVGGPSGFVTLTATEVGETLEVSGFPVPTPSDTEVGGQYKRTDATYSPAVVSTGPILGTVFAYVRFVDEDGVETTPVAIVASSYEEIVVSQLSAAGGFVIRGDALFSEDDVSTETNLYTNYSSIPPPSKLSYTAARIYRTLPGGTTFFLDVTHTGADMFLDHLDSVGYDPIKLAAKDSQASSTVSLANTYTAYCRFVDEYGNPSNLGGLDAATSGGPPFTYTNVPIPAESKVVRRQLFRSPAGSRNVYYLEIDTTDLTSDTFTGTLTDEELIAKTPLAILDDTQSIYANVYNPPPSHKSVLAYHLGRMFLAVDVEYATGNAMVTSGSAVVRGVGTSWASSMVGRAFYGYGERSFLTILSVDEDAQELVLDGTWTAPDDPFCTYAIRPRPEERRLVYFSQALVPEGWPPTFAVSVMEDGDEITGMIAFNSFLYIIEKRNSYKFTFRSDPLKDGNIFSAVNRGCVNQRCIVTVEDSCYMLDELGVHKFNGTEAEPVSQPIQDIFQDDPSAVTINWSADRRLWHAAWDSAREVIRWFVSFGVDPEPRHAICYQYRLQRWWIERYDRPVTSSASGNLPNQRCLVGSTGRSVLVLGQGYLDGVLDTVQSRWLVSGSTALSVVVASAPGALAPEFVGYPVAIASGRGARQVRTVVAVVGNRAYVDRPWMVAPGVDSVCQFGGFAWEWRSGVYRYADDEEGNPRDVEVIYQPTRKPASFDLNLYLDHSEVPEPRGVDSDDDGVAIRAGDPNITVAMAGAGGYFILRGEGHAEVYATANTFLSIGLAGVSSAQLARFYQVTINGVES